MKRRQFWDGERWVQIDEMVRRFLTWPLPASVTSDSCVTQPDYPHRVGTNLLTADEAQQMLEHVLAPATEPTALPGGGALPVWAAIKALLEVQAADARLWTDPQSNEYRPAAVTLETFRMAHKALFTAVAYAMDHHPPDLSHGKRTDR